MYFPKGEKMVDSPISAKKINLDFFCFSLHYEITESDYYQLPEQTLLSKIYYNTLEFLYCDIRK